MRGAVLAAGLDLAERGLVPERWVRLAIRRLCARHAAGLAARRAAAAEQDVQTFLAAARRGPIALVPESANEQHYEVPAAFFAEVLGEHRKYSACYWPEGISTLTEAEAAALRVTCERADLHDGQRVLELGCGWGALSLWMAAAYPGSRIVAVSNSTGQRGYIEEQARRRGLVNLEVRTLDMNLFEPCGPFDRVVSVEMFEHMRNWEELLRRVAASLAADGSVFLHVFCHRDSTYAYETTGPENWLGRHFFTGGMMPSRDYLSRLDTPLEIVSEWTWDGTHYQRTADAWAANLVARREAVFPILESAYGRKDAPRWFARWRLFFLACSEMFGLHAGREWFVGHYRLGHARRNAAL